MPRNVFIHPNTCNLFISGFCNNTNIYLNSSIQVFEYAIHNHTRFLYILWANALLLLPIYIFYSLRAAAYMIFIAPYLFRAFPPKRNDLNERMERGTVTTTHLLCLNFSQKFANIKKRERHLINLIWMVLCVKRCGGR